MCESGIGRDRCKSGKNISITRGHEYDVDNTDPSVSSQYDPNKMQNITSDQMHLLNEYALLNQYVNGKTISNDRQQAKYNFRSKRQRPQSAPPHCVRSFKSSDGQKDGNSTYYRMIGQRFDFDTMRNLNQKHIDAIRFEQTRQWYAHQDKISEAGVISRIENGRYDSLLSEHQTRRRSRSFGEGSTGIIPNLRIDRKSDTSRKSLRNLKKDEARSDSSSRSCKRPDNKTGNTLRKEFIRIKPNVANNTGKAQLTEVIQDGAKSNMDKSASTSGKESKKFRQNGREHEEDSKTMQRTNRGNDLGTPSSKRIYQKGQSVAVAKTSHDASDSNQKPGSKKVRDSAPSIEPTDYFKKVKIVKKSHEPPKSDQVVNVIKLVKIRKKSHKSSSDRDSDDLKSFKSLKMSCNPPDGSAKSDQDADDFKPDKRFKKARHSSYDSTKSQRGVDELKSSKSLKNSREPSFDPVKFNQVADDLRRGLKSSGNSYDSNRSYQHGDDPKMGKSVSKSNRDESMQSDRYKVDFDDPKKLQDSSVKIVDKVKMTRTKGMAEYPSYKSMKECDLKKIDKPPIELATSKRKKVIYFRSRHSIATSVSMFKLLPNRHAVNQTPLVVNQVTSSNTKKLVCLGPTNSITTSVPIRQDRNSQGTDITEEDRQLLTLPNKTPNLVKSRETGTDMAEVDEQRLKKLIKLTGELSAFSDRNVKHDGKIPMEDTISSVEAKDLVFSKPLEVLLNFLCKGETSSFETRQNVNAVAHNILRADAKEHALKKSSIFVRSEGCGKLQSVTRAPDLDDSQMTATRPLYNLDQFLQHNDYDLQNRISKVYKSKESKGTFIDHIDSKCNIKDASEVLSRRIAKCDNKKSQGTSVEQNDSQSTLNDSFLVQPNIITKESDPKTIRSTFNGKNNVDSLVNNGYLLDELTVAENNELKKELGFIRNILVGKSIRDYQHPKHLKELMDYNDTNPTSLFVMPVQHPQLKPHNVKKSDVSPTSAKAGKSKKITLPKAPVYVISNSKDTTQIEPKKTSDSIQKKKEGNRSDAAEESQSRSKEESDYGKPSTSSFKKRVIIPVQRSRLESEKIPTILTDQQASSNEQSVLPSIGYDNAIGSAADTMKVGLKKSLTHINAGLLSVGISIPGPSSLMGPRQDLITETNTLSGESCESAGKNMETETVEGVDRKSQVSHGNAMRNDRAQQLFQQLHSSGIDDQIYRNAMFIMQNKFKEKMSMKLKRTISSTSQEYAPKVSEQKRFSMRPVTSKQSDEPTVQQIEQENVIEKALSTIQKKSQPFIQIQDDKVKPINSNTSEAYVLKVKQQKHNTIKEDKTD